MDVLKRLEQAFNDRDLEALVACFREDVVVNHPAHPAFSIKGRDQIWRTWAPILAGMEDFKATIIRSCAGDDQVWAEWHWQGLQAHGSEIEIVGVIIHGVEGDEITWARFYMEPIEQGRPGWVTGP